MMKRFHIIIIISLLLISFQFKDISINENDYTNANDDDTNPLLNNDITKGINVIYYDWHRIWGGEMCFDIETDTEDNVYIFGSVWTVGGDSFLIIKYNPEGEQIWNQTYAEISLMGKERGDLIIDESNNIYFTSRCQTGHRMIITKCNSSGDMKWQTIWDSPEYSWGNGITLDDSNNIYVSGYATLNGEAKDCLVKFNSTGHYQWNNTWGNPYYYYPNGIVIDSNSEIYVGGNDFFGMDTSYLCKFNTSGDLIWNKTIDHDFVQYVVLDAEENVYCGGYSYINGSRDCLLTKFNSSGDQLWNRTWGGVEDEEVLCMKVSSDNNIFLTGYTESYGTYQDMYILKYNKYGEYQWHEIWDRDDNVDSISCGIAFDSSENVYLGGTTYMDSDVYDEILLVKFKNLLNRIKIESPINNQMIARRAPDFQLLIDETNVSLTWYTLDNGITNYSFNGNFGTVNQSAWDNCEEGQVILTFYAKYLDNAIYSDNVIIIKDLTYKIPKEAYAILIGIEDYYGSANDLEYCHEDVNELYDFLISECNYKPQNIYKLLEVSEPDIENKISSLKNILKPQDTLLFYYSGHGGYNGVNHFIAPLGAVQFGGSLRTYDFELANSLSGLTCAEMYIFLDSCNSGGFIDECQDEGRFIMTACQGSEESIEDLGNKHGLFTYYLLKALSNAEDLNNDGGKSVEEWFPYIRDHTEARSNYLGFGHTPANSDNIIGSSFLYPCIGGNDFIFGENSLSYSFNLYGQGQIIELTLTLCTVSDNISLVDYNLIPNSFSDTGFELYAGDINLLDVTGYRIIAKIYGNNTVILRNYGGKDTDNDRLMDIEEITIYSTDPRLNDTDGDGWNDGDELDQGTDPLDPDDYPKINGTNNSISGYPLTSITILVFMIVIFYIKKTNRKR